MKKQTHWIVDKPITFLIYEDQSGPRRIGEELLNADNMPIFIDKLPVLYEKVVDASNLEYKPQFGNEVSCIPPM